MVRSLSFLFLDGLEGNANISVAMKSGSTVLLYYCSHVAYQLDLAKLSSNMAES